MRVLVSRTCAETCVSRRCRVCAGMAGSEQMAWNGIFDFFPVQLELDLDASEVLHLARTSTTWWLPR